MDYLDTLTKKDLIRLRTYLENFQSIGEVKIILEESIKSRHKKSNINHRLNLSEIPHSKQVDDIFKERGIKTVGDLIDVGAESISKGPVTKEELIFISKMYDMREAHKRLKKM